ncbi:hypothetical protein ES703_31820 [subsurface metagenome]
MADDDLLSDARYDIASYITAVLNDLFNREVNPFNWPTWLQAALLFDECVIPCNYMPPNQLYYLAGSIVDEASKNDNRIEFYQYKGEERILVDTMDITEKIERIEEWMKNNEKWMKINELWMRSNDIEFDFDVRSNKATMEKRPERKLEGREVSAPNLNQVIQELKKIRNHKGFLQLLKLDFSKINDEEIIELIKIIDEHTVISSEFRRKKFSLILKNLTINVSDEVKARAIASWALNYPNIEDREFMWERLHNETDEFLDAFFYEVGDIEFWWGKLFSEDEAPQLKLLAKKHPIFSETIINYLARLNISDISDLMISLYHKSKSQHLSVLRYLSENPSEDAKELLKNDIEQHKKSTSFGSSSRLVLAAVALSSVQGEDAIDIVLENCYDLFYWVAQIAQRYLRKRLIKEEDQTLKKEIEEKLVELEPQTYMISPEEAEKVFEKLRNKNDSNSDFIK